MAKKSAKVKILELFQANANKWIPIYDIQKIAQISEWARTIRFLRAEGWQIKKGGSGATTEYCLISLEKNEGVVRGPINPRTRAEVLRRDDYRCVHCGKSPKEDNFKLEVDHIIPVAWGEKLSQIIFNHYVESVIKVRRAIFLISTIMMLLKK